MTMPLFLQGQLLIQNTNPVVAERIRTRRCFLLFFALAQTQPEKVIQVPQDTDKPLHKALGAQHLRKILKNQIQYWQPELLKDADHASSRSADHGIPAILKQLSQLLAGNDR
jgi:hypothetical protein